MNIQWFNRKKQIKIILLIVAIIIALASLLVSHNLTKKLSNQERTNMEIWSEAMRSLNRADANTDLILVLKIINGNNNIPIIVLNAQNEIETFRNIKIIADTRKDSLLYLKNRAISMQTEGYSMKINLSDQADKTSKEYIKICYDESSLLKQLALFPYIQIGIVSLFILIGIVALLNSKKAEENRVWVGLSKETAHQLGTPISSLLAWVEILKEQYPKDITIPELHKDIDRLELIADRFSKIGSQPEPKMEDLRIIIYDAVEYLKHRTSGKVSFSCKFPEYPVNVKLNASLFQWVIENLCKNAIDAMSGKGSITLSIKRDYKTALEITDTGKGISKKDFKSIFMPGFTTKRRGWGLGLSLAKRIVEEYHSGRIYVKNSEINVGTTFRIEFHDKLDA